MLHELTAAGDFDPNFQDGLGNTALHYAASSASIDVLPELLELEVDVDLHNRTTGNTPLHAALEVENEEARNWIGERSLTANLKA